MDKPITFSEWLGTQGNMALVHANCCRIAYEAGQQSQQAKVEELQKRVDAALAVLTEYYTGSYDESPDLVVDIEQALKGEGL
ncbi:hypothetical protein [Acinetobacter calcoaceticus]|uniref:hypothetical protein n=1 Tax=Acinetobacter calcoaceticus TaxID=471 RepID=UPI003AF5C66E